jgi:hypothetical protein
MTRPTVICLTPIKNEAGVLQRFLSCASLWADHIIISDQSSDDGSKEIARGHHKVTLIDNPSQKFNQSKQQELCVDAARKIPGPRLLIALDADEVLTANVMDSPEWNTILCAKPGTVIGFQWPVILPDIRSYWMPPKDQRFGFIDDGTKYIGKEIHSNRIPVPQIAANIFLRNIKVMHFVGVDEVKWESKHRWYQCWERLNEPKKRAVDIYRQYHKKNHIPRDKIEPIPRDWIAGYEKEGIDLTSIYRERILRWDEDILKWLLEHGTKKFRRVAIWDVNWSARYRMIYGRSPAVSLNDPRSKFEKLVHIWLKRTQHHFSYFEQQTTVSKLTAKFCEKLLRFFGW